MQARATNTEVDCDRYHAIFAVSDVRTAIEFYTTKLGFWLAFAEGDPPTFAGVNIGHVQLFLEKGTPNPQGCAAYFVVSDADALYQFHLSNEVEILQPIEDRPYHLRDYTVSDADGYRLTFGHQLNK
jgi:catechol 2,3-dioxygenase-like lactoylglutathione lyase family enzyme